jgi:hypothetical protein
MDVHPPKNGINRYWSIPIWNSDYSGFLIAMLHMFDNERVTYPMFNTRYPKTCLADLSELLVRLLGGDLCTVLIWMVLPRVAGESETAALSQKKWFLDDAGSVHHFHQKYPISWHTKHSDSTIGAPLFPKKNRAKRTCRDKQCEGQKL